ncbi:nucleoside triphosphate pyrophosphohydrolase [Luteibacter sp. PPL201]|uniref:Nucleoside triphosphate pyrophosphohydrolase n=1 Tax=Luteibacter sahnii TaxID=3021977 RepID=A0ABT6BA20_9GAMM|nr:nucleoside triphosphate pyrophosphohydrolase [Luteibacter sp. PPL193]MDY1546921.1 nucleoside triphosphate pyrophosphohydrolase [Luteibacter sp. PPL193]
MTRPIDDLLAIMARLRDPDTGCPWDIKQSFATIAPYTIEEAYEVADAIDRRDMHDLRDELGDLLLQVVFHARMAEEDGHFAFGDVVASICDKMRRRHPHVFGDVTHDSDAERSRDWDRLKAEERKAKGTDDTSALAGISRGLPEWQRAVKLHKRAANTGFDWPDYRPVLTKLAEEIDEVRHEFEHGADPARLADEIGDVLFVATNLARHAGVDVSHALRGANAKFERRFRAMESLAAQEGRTLSSYPLDEQEHLWARVKRDETPP